MHKTQREAVALEYGLNKAPVVVAKGTEEIAEKILEEAKKHGVYVARDPQLLAMLARLSVALERDVLTWIDADAEQPRNGTTNASRNRSMAA